MGRAPDINLDSAERDDLDDPAHRPTAEQRRTKRAKIILLADEEMTNLDLADEVGYRHETVGQRRRRYAEHGRPGLEDQPRNGAPRTFSPEDRIPILNTATTPPQGMPATGASATSRRSSPTSTTSRSASAPSTPSSRTSTSNPTASNGR